MEHIPASTGIDTSRNTLAALLALAKALTRQLDTETHG